MRRLISDNSLHLKRYFQTLMLRLTYLNLLQVDNLSWWLTKSVSGLYVGPRSYRAMLNFFLKNC